MLSRTRISASARVRVAAGGRVRARAARRATRDRRAAAVQRSRCERTPSRIVACVRCCSRRGRDPELLASLDALPGSSPSARRRSKPRSPPPSSRARKLADSGRRMAQAGATASRAAPQGRSRAAFAGGADAAARRAVCRARARQSPRHAGAVAARTHRPRSPTRACALRCSGAWRALLAGPLDDDAGAEVAWAELLTLGGGRRGAQLHACAGAAARRRRAARQCLRRLGALEQDRARSAICCTNTGICCARACAPGGG